MVPARFRRCGADDRGRGAGRRAAGARTRRSAPAERLTYAEAMRRHAGVDPHAAPTTRARSSGRAPRASPARPSSDRDAQARSADGTRGRSASSARERPCFICDYPASQASLARLKPGIAARRGALRALSGRHRARQRLPRARRRPRTARPLPQRSRDRAARAASPSRRWMSICWPRSPPACPTAPASPWASTAWSPSRSSATRLVRRHGFPIDNA